MLSPHRQSTWRAFVPSCRSLQPLLLPQKWPYGVLTVLGGDYGVQLDYDSDAYTVCIGGASATVHDRVVKMLRTALAHCASEFDKVSY